MLYPVAGRALMPQDHADLACEWVEREEMGEGEHERFHVMIEHLEREMAGTYARDASPPVTPSGSRQAPGICARCARAGTA